MAFIRNGYRYHTKFDDFESIPPGSIQHMGDNTLSLVKQLADAPELPRPTSQLTGNVIFFDVLGLYMVTYKEHTAFVLNLAAVAVSLLLAFKSCFEFDRGNAKQHLKYVLLSVGVVLLGWTISALFVFVIATVLDLLGYTMSWYRNPWMIFGLYVVPILALTAGCWTAFNSFNKKENLSDSALSQIQANVVRLVWSVILLIGTCLKIRAVYAIMIPVVFNNIIFSIIYILRWQYSVRKWQILYIIIMAIPNIFLMQQSITIVTLFIPISGRFGSLINPEIVLGYITLLLTILITSFYMPLITLVQKPKKIFSLLCGVFVIFFIIVFTPLGFPYSGDKNAAAPQRFWIYHTSRVFHNETGNIYKKDSGFFILNMDRNSPSSVVKLVKDFKIARSVEEDCKSSLYCGLPLASPRMLQIMNESTWIPAEQPVIHIPTVLKLESKSEIHPNVVRYQFSASGPSHLSLYFAPKSGTKLHGISLTTPLPPTGPIWNDRPSYFILYIAGKEVSPLKFHIDIEKPQNWDGPTLDIAILGKYVHERENRKTPHYQQFLNEFPDWADLTAWLGTYESFIF